MCRKQKIFPSISGEKELSLSPLYKHSETVESVDHYTFLGTTIDSKLKFSTHCDIIFRKGQQRLHFLRKVRSSNVDQTILTLFYTSFIQSVLTFSIICWCDNLSVSDTNKLSKIVNIGSRTTGQQQPSLANAYDRQVLKKAQQC